MKMYLILLQNDLNRKEKIEAIIQPETYDLVEMQLKIPRQQFCLPATLKRKASAGAEARVFSQGWVPPLREGSNQKPGFSR